MNAHGCLLPLACALVATVLTGPAVGGSGARAEPASPPQQLPIEARWCPESRPAAEPASRQAPPPQGCVALEVPRTWHQHMLGLQLRPPLPAGRGMWFAYRPAQAARFWMHRTPQPLDIVFVQQERVIAIQAAAPPCMRLPCPSYGPDRPVDGVLELGTGEAARLGLVLGSPLRVDLLRPFGPQAPAPD